MNLLPNDIDFLKNASAVSARDRGLLPLVPTKVTNDFTVAIKCIGVYQSLESEAELQKLDDEEFSKPLIAAGRILLGMANSSQELHDPVELCFMRLHAALAFAMQGNFPSSKAALREIPEKFIIGTSLRLMAATVCDPIAATRIYNENSEIVSDYNFGKYFLHSLKSANSDFLRLAIEILATQTNFSNREETSLLLSVEVACRQAYRLSTAHLYITSPEIPAWFIDGAIKKGILTLLPPQRSLLSTKKIAIGNENLLLNLPTSTGKTFIAEACMAASVKNGGISFFIAPYVAIGNQALQSLKSKCGDSVEIISMFGGHYASKISLEKPTIVVATPERFDAWLRIQQATGLLRLVVFDEIHYIENGARGARLEGIISRLLLIQRRQPLLRLMGLSAVLPGAGTMTEWLKVPNSAFHFLSWRPTARRVAICKSNGEISWLNGTDALRPNEKKSDDPFAHSIKIDLKTVSSSAYFPTKEAEHSSGSNVAQIAIDLSKRLGGIGLIVCPRRADTRQLASILANYYPPIDKLSPLHILIDKLRLAYPWMNKLIYAIERGIAYHNASLPHEIRREIEYYVKSGDIKFVASTTTLAEGADLPFRWTLVSHWLQGLHPEGVPLKSLTFRNMAGRSGRAGYYTEGDTIVFHNTLGNRQAIGAPGLISEKVNEVMFGAAPVTSALHKNENDLQDLIPEPIRAACASQLLACIAENPNSNDIVKDLVLSTYANASGDYTLIHEALIDALNQTLVENEAGGPFAVRNSPVRLTELGIAANRSGFSPKSCRLMLQFVNEENFPKSDPEIIAKAIIYFASIPELQDHYLKKVCTEPKQRSFLKKNDLSTVIGQHLNKSSIRDMFDLLPSRIRSKAADDYVEKEFDKFSQAIESTIPNFISWILRGVATMSHFSASAQLPQPDWLTLSRSLHNPQSSPVDSEPLDEE